MINSCFNDQVSTWVPLLFLIYINDLSDNLSSNVKLSADDSALFSVINDINISSGELNKHLKKSETGLFTGKWFLIQMLVSKLKKLCLEGKWKKPPLILLSFSTMLLSLILTHKKNYKLPCNFEAKLEEIIAIVTTHSVFLFINKIC